MPRLCAGRRASRSARLSGAAAAGERRQYLVRVGVGQSGYSDRDPAEAAARLDRPRPNRRGIRKFRCRAICTSRSGAIRRASNSATAQSLDALLAEIAAAKPALRRIRSPMAIRWRRRPKAFAHWSATPVNVRARALERAGDLLEAAARHVPRAAAERGRQDARRCGRRMARGDRLLPLLRGAGAQDADCRRRCRGRPENPTSCAIAGAACSCASRRGIFRSRFSWAR